MHTVKVARIADHGGARGFELFERGGHIEGEVEETSSCASVNVLEWKSALKRKEESLVLCSTNCCGGW